MKTFGQVLILIGTLFQRKIRINYLRKEKSGGLKGKGDEEKGKCSVGQLKYYGAASPNTMGWGYQGLCWRCGNVGHKANECRKKIQEVVEVGSLPQPMYFAL